MKIENNLLKKIIKHYAWVYDQYEKKLKNCQLSIDQVPEANWCWHIPLRERVGLEEKIKLLQELATKKVGVNGFYGDEGMWLKVILEGVSDDIVDALTLKLESNRQDSGKRARKFQNSELYKKVEEVVK